MTTITNYRKRYPLPTYKQDRRTYINRDHLYKKYMTTLPKPLKFLQQNLFSNKNVHTDNEKKLILRYRSHLLKVYRLKIRIKEELQLNVNL